MNRKPYFNDFSSYIFLYSTLMFHLAFAFIIPLYLGMATPLFVGMAGVHASIPIAWGWIGLASLITAYLGIERGNAHMVKSFATVQVVLWAFAFYTYLTGVNAIMAFAIAAPHLLFWGWNYLRKQG